MLDEKRVLARLRDAAFGMRDYWQKVYRLRRIVAGDKEALYTDAVGINFDEGFKNARAFRESCPDILMQQFEEGRNNTMLNLLGVLVGQTVFSFPKIEIRNLTPHMQVVNSRYLTKRLTECGAIHHARIAVWDYLTGGCGDIYLPMDDGKPVARWADALDIKFDQIARLPCDIRWKSITVCQPLEVWSDMFGKERFAEIIPGRKNDDSQPGIDTPVELEFYYDIEKDGGNYMVFRKISEMGYDEKPVYKGTNPNYFVEGGEKRPFLPFESLFYEARPSVRLPVGMAEKGLPAQIAVWRAVKRVQDIIDRCVAFYEIEEGAVDTEKRQEFMEAMLGGFAWVKELGHIKEHPAMQIQATDLEELKRNLDELKLQFGTSNYSLGGTESGVKFAREVNAAVGLGSQTGSALSKDNAEWWSRWTPKILAKGKLYDRRPITIRVDGEDYQFNAQDPISDYLVPDAELNISEDTMRFVPPQARIQQATGVLQITMELQQQFPFAVGPAFRKYLEANGVEDIEERMKQPQLQQQMQQAGAAAPGQQGLNPQMSAEVGAGV